MKSFRLLALILLPIITFAASMTKYAGAGVEHNYVMTNRWTLVSTTGDTLATDDSVYLYRDTTGSTHGYDVSNLRNRSIAPYSADLLPDSLQFCVEGKSIADVSTITHKIQYSLDNGTNWGLLGTATGSTVIETTRGITCFKYGFVPTAMYRWIAWPSTATDTLILYKAIASPSFK